MWDISQYRGALQFLSVHSNGMREEWGDLSSACRDIKRKIISLWSTHHLLAEKAVNAFWQWMVCFWIMQMPFNRAANYGKVVVQSRYSHFLDFLISLRITGMNLNGPQAVWFWINVNIWSWFQQALNTKKRNIFFSKLMKMSKSSVYFGSWKHPARNPRGKKNCHNNRKQSYSLLKTDWNGIRDLESKREKNEQTYSVEVAESFVWF